jgi:hypothetical protein
VITSSAFRISEPRAARATLACLIVLGAVLWLSAATGSAEGVAPAEETAQLLARFERLSARDDAAYAQGAIDQARRALARAETATEDEEEARIRGIARAAMELAERQLHRREIQAELIATQRRLTATRERAAAQRRVLEALMKERASLSRAGEQP